MQWVFFGFLNISLCYYDFNQSWQQGILASHSRVISPQHGSPSVAIYAAGTAEYTSASKPDWNCRIYMSPRTEASEHPAPFVFKNHTSDIRSSKINIYLQVSQRAAKTRQLSQKRGSSRRPARRVCTRIFSPI